MQSSFELHVPTNLAFSDFLAVTQTARAWADGYDLKSYEHLISTLASVVVIDYTDVNPAWGKQTYNKEDFAKLWLSEEHLGNSALRTQHLLATPYFSYVGARRVNSTTGRSENVVGNHVQHSVSDSQAVSEIEVSWQTLASHGRQSSASEMTEKQVGETSDHRAFMVQIYVKECPDMTGKSTVSPWRLASIKPQLIYMAGDFASVRRPVDDTNEKVRA